MAFAEEDAVVAEFFGALRALVDLVDGFDPAVDAVEAEFQRHLILREDTQTRGLTAKNAKRAK